jgi:hypothetical protein
MFATVLRSTLIPLCFVAAATSNPALAVEAGGVQFREEIRLHGSPLVLNGAGVRWKGPFKVYAAALYLGARATATRDLLQATDMPRRLQLVMLRDIDANELGRMFIRSMERNIAPSEIHRVMPGLAKMGEIFATRRQLAAGDVLHIDWVPSRGTVILINGEAASDPIPEPLFQSAMLKIWLGDSPADARLKDALLGTTKEAYTREP